MTRRVFKYDVPPVDRFTVSMPIGAKILSVQAQGGRGKMWVEVDDANEESIEQFYVAGTGHVLPEEAVEFLGTFHMFDGELVLHLYRGGAV